MTDYPDDPHHRNDPPPTHWHCCSKCGRLGDMRAKLHDDKPTETSPGEQWWTVHCVCGAWCLIDGEPQQEPDDEEPDGPTARTKLIRERLTMFYKEAGR